MTMRVERLVVGPLQTNCYVLHSDDEAVVIDPGAPEPRLLKAVEGHRVRLRYILLTHAHFDHLEGARALKEAHPESLLCLHEADRPMLERFAPGLKLERALHEGDLLEFAAEELKVWHTPGHSPGSVIFIHERERIIFTGDLLFAGSIGRTDLPGGSPAQMERSLRRLMQLEGDYRVLPGHGPETTLAQERVSNPFLRELGELWLPERR